MHGTCVESQKVVMSTASSCFMLSVPSKVKNRNERNMPAVPATAAMMSA
jgi:hypothetical protein